MKKILSFFVMFGLILGMSGFVLADDQGGSGSVTVDTTCTFDPSELIFSSMIPGDSDFLENHITIGTSPLEITAISVTPTTGTIFNADNVLFSDTEEGTFVTGTAYVPAPIQIAAEGTHDFYVQMTIPVGTLSGDYAGTITYTLMESSA